MILNAVVSLLSFAVRIVDRELQRIRGRSCAGLMLCLPTSVFAGRVAATILRTGTAEKSA